MPDRPAPSHRAALGVLGLCTAINVVSRGVGESFAVFLLPVADAFGADRGALTGIYGLYMLVLGLMSPIAGTAFDRLGPRATYSIGLAVFGLAYLLAGSVTALWQVYLLVGLGGAVGASLIGMLPASGLASRWFGARLPVAMGVLSASLGVGILLFAPLVHALIEAYGWRTAYRLLGALLLAVWVATAPLPWRRIAAGADDVVRARSAAAGSAPAWSIRRALGTSTFWSLFGVMFFTSMSTYAVAPQLVAYLVSAGVPPLRAASVYGIVGLASIVGMIGAGALAQRIGERRVALLSYGSTLAGVAALAMVRHAEPLAFAALFVLLFGTMQGSRGPLVAVLSARHFAGGSQTGIFGAILLGMGTGGALGAWGSGELYDLTRGYDASLALSALGAACGLALFLRVPALGGRARASG
ncbi:MAG: MFS transporter [Burkholderiales bacterium]